MKHLKKIALIFAVVVCFAVCFFAVETSATTYGTYGDLSYSISDNKVTITSCSTSASGKLEIPSKIKGNLVTSIGGYAFRFCNNLTSIIIPKTVSSIGYEAFGDCCNITDVTISNGIKSIGDCAFYDCFKLKSINIPDSVTSIGVYAFKGCYNLCDVSIGKSVTSIGKCAFYGCNNILKVSTTDINAWCRISFSNCSANPVYYSKNLYFNGKAVTSVTVPSDVKKLNYTFCGFSRLTSVFIPDSVTKINGAFFNCSRIEKITIPDTVTSIGGNTFRGCTNLTSIKIPNNVTSIGNSVFSGCSGLTSIIISNNVTSIGKEAFYKCSKLTSIKIPNSVTSIGNEAFRLCKSITTINIPNGVTSIGWGMFWECSSLKSVSIPNSVTGIEANAFYRCYKLKNITIPNKVTSIGYDAFSNCTSLKSVIIPNNVTSIDNRAFGDCKNLTNIVIGKNIIKIAKDIFENCPKLSKIAVLNNDFDAVDLIKTLNKGVTIYAYDTLDNKDMAKAKGIKWVELSDYNCTKGAHCFSFYDSTVTKKATCTTTGTKSVKCLLCSKASTETIPKTGHTAVTLSARTATVKQSGLTAGSKCSVCGKVLKAQAMTLAQATGLKSSAVSSNSITLKWTAINGAKYYKVEQYNASTKKWIAIKTTTATSYTVSKLGAGTAYKFRVTALDSTKKISGKASATLTVSTLLVAPSFSLTSIKSKTATVTVTKLTGAFTYTIYKSTDNKSWSKVATTDNTTYNITGLTASKKIYIKIVGNYSNGKVSDYSSVKSVTVKK